MNPQARASYLRTLNSIAEQATDEALPRLSTGMTWTRGEDVLTLGENAAAAFLEFVGKLSQQAIWSERASETYIQDRLIPVLNAYRKNDPTSAAASFDALVADVEACSLEQIAFVPVDQIILRVDPLRIGQVTFRNIHDQTMDEIMALIESGLEEGSRTAEHQERIETWLQQFRENLTGKVCAEYRAIGEPGRIRERAVQETRRALELITCANAARFPGLPQADAVACIEGETPAVGPVLPVVAPGHANWQVTTSEKALVIELTPAALEHYDKIGFWVLSDLLCRQVTSLSEFEDALLRGAHWIAVSQTQAELETRLLNLMTAVEALVGPKGDPIRVAIAEGTALIVAEGYVDRLDTRKFLVGLYEARSTLSHGGKKPITESDIRRLRSIALSLLSILVRWSPGLKTRQDLLDWLVKARLSGAQLAPPVASDAPKPLRAHREARGWSVEELAGHVPRASIDADAVRGYEEHVPGPIELRFLADALEIRPDEIALPPNQQWVGVQDHLFHLTAGRNGPGNWTARVTGWDYAEATEWLRRPLDSDQPERDHPNVTLEWTSSGLASGLALSALEDKIRVAWERALMQERLPDEPADWTPLSVPEHWQEHVAQMKRRNVKK